MTAKELACASARCPDERGEGLPYIHSQNLSTWAFGRQLGQAEAGKTKESNIPNLRGGSGQPSCAAWLGRNRTLNAPSVGLGGVRIGSGVIKLFILPAPKAASTVMNPKLSLKHSEKEGKKQ